MTETVPQALYEAMADLALKNGHCVSDGLTGVVAVPDVAVMEARSNGWWRDELPPPPILRRRDGRTVMFFRSPRHRTGRPGLSVLPFRSPRAAG